MDIEILANRLLEYALNENATEYNRQVMADTVHELGRLLAEKNLAENRAERRRKDNAALKAENEKLRAELEQLRPARGAVKEEKMKEDHKTLTPEQQEMALYERAVDTFGASAQILQAVEEMSELTKALLKYIRFRNFGQGVREDLLADISEERADVSIMLNQLEVIFGDNSADECLKLQHLQQLLEAYQEGGANADHHH